VSKDKDKIVPKVHGPKNPFKGGSPFKKGEKK
jgi:hypothetical protein